MRRSILTVIMIFACLMWMDSPSAKRGRIPAQGHAAAGDMWLRELVPASALLAVEVRDLERRWEEIRCIQPIAGLQDAILSCAGMKASLLPRLMGNHAVLFLARSDHYPHVVPIAILRPADPDQAVAVLAGIPTVSFRFGRGALWVGPSGAEDLLEHFSQEEGARLVEVLPFEEMQSRLPSGGLIRGLVNPKSLQEFLQDLNDRAGSAMHQWPIAAAVAELGTVRYAAFRRDLEDGELVTDGLVVYDVPLLPLEVQRIFNPQATPVSLPSELPANTLAAFAFRPEAQAWVPWLRYLAASDPRGPLRNLGFWIDEFEARYRRDLVRDLFGALGDRAWLLALSADNGRMAEFVLIVEARESPVLEATLLDSMSWMGEQLWLGTFGLIWPKTWLEDGRGRVVHGMTLHTPVSRTPGLRFELADGYLVIAGNPAAMQAGRALVEKIRQVAFDGGAASSGLPVHGTFWIRGAELGRLIRAGAESPSFSGCICNAIADLAAESDTLGIELRYGHDAVRFHGRLRIATLRTKYSIP